MEDRGKELLKLISSYIEEIENAHLTNEQFFIEWENELNKLSVLDHEKTRLS